MNSEVKVCIYFGNGVLVLWAVGLRNKRLKNDVWNIFLNLDLKLLMWFEFVWCYVALLNHRLRKSKNIFCLQMNFASGTWCKHRFKLHPWLVTKVLGLKKKRKFIFGLVVPVWKRRQSLTFWTGLQCSQCGLYCFILTMSSLFHSRYLSRHATEEELCVTTQITTA